MASMSLGDIERVLQRREEVVEAAAGTQEVEHWGSRKRTSWTWSVKK
jgi:hypothetical protein